MHAGNSAYANAGNVYKRNEIFTASKKKIVSMLYDGVNKNLKLAKISMAEGSIAKTNMNIAKAQDILTELMGTLNFDAGGNIAPGLMNLYQYMYGRTIRANIDKDSAIIDEVVGLMDELRDTWSKI